MQADTAVTAVGKFLQAIARANLYETDVIRRDEEDLNTVCFTGKYLSDNAKYGLLALTNLLETLENVAEAKELLDDKTLANLYAVMGTLSEISISVDSHMEEARGKLRDMRKAAA